MNKEMTEDLKALYEIIDEYVTDKNDHHFSMYHLGGVIESLEKQPLQGWIPTSETDPGFEDTYLVTVLDKRREEEMIYVTRAYYLPGGGWVIDSENRLRVIAWMHEPEPFEPKEEQ